MYRQELDSIVEQMRPRCRKLWDAIDEVVGEHAEMLADEIGLDCDKKYMAYLVLREIVFDEEYTEEDIADELEMQ